MTLAQYVAKSVSDARVLIQLDIAQYNLQWVNYGPGIWKVNFDNLYPEIDSTLLDGFSAQSISDIGSVMVDGILQTSVDALSSLSPEKYYWDNTNNDLYVCILNYDKPWLHNISVGIIYGLSYDEFTPIGASSLYEGRLLGSINISQSRDPLFWGKMQYNMGNISLINTDANYDTFAKDNDIYGNEIRTYYGFNQLDITNYVKLYTGTIQNISISEEDTQIQISDKRKQLTRPIQYVCTAKNALDAIVEILEQSYNIQYNPTYFDITAWETAQALVPNVTIHMDTSDEYMSTIDLIQLICSDVFGLFKITPENKYSFKIVDTTASAMTTIGAEDILNTHSYLYDPSEVISSTRVGYDKNWTPGYTTPYYWLNDYSRENAIFLKYKIYNSRKFFTLLTNSTDAQSFSDTILDYAQDVHAKGNITVPMSYYSYEVGDIVNIEIERETITMLGTTKVEIISKSYNLKDNNITFGYRVI